MEKSNGKTIQKYITYTQWYQEDLIAVENVPAEVCETCNGEYFSPGTVDKLQIAIELYRSYKTIPYRYFNFLKC
ncbi:MAG: YgiT-type zinc finger protein [Candidatus Brocadia sp.]|nr:YgiT-type zinc finger protein [Candidatus Brocadia sp.]